MEKEAPPLAQQQKTNRQQRPYPMAAPLIPHAIEGFIINKDFNQCMVCHAGDRAPLMRAPTIGESHYINRAGNYLLEVSDRRYFCNQCHVPQTDATPLVKNNY